MGLYISLASPRRRERRDSEGFSGLPGDINQALTTYGQYRVFQLLPQPTLLAE